MRKSSGYRILSIIGEQGTGKTSIAKALAHGLEAQHIEVSTLVAELYLGLDRSELWRTKKATYKDPSWLGTAISEHITNKRVILSGVREPEIHTTLRKLGHTLAIVALWCPEQERYVRVRNTGKCKSYSEFQQLGEKEMSMGLRELLAYNLKDGPPTFVTSSFESVENVAELIKDQLSRGWKVKKGQVL